MKGCKPHKVACQITKCDVKNDVKLFPTVYCRIYCRKFRTLSNQMSHDKSKCIRMKSTRWVSFHVKITRQCFANVCWHRETCRTIQHAFSTSGKLYIKSRKHGILFYQFINCFTLQTSDYDVSFDFCVDSASLATSFKKCNVSMTLLSCISQLSTKNSTKNKKTKIPTNKAVSYFKSLRCVFYHANKSSLQCYSVLSDISIKMSYAYRWKGNQMFYLLVKVSLPISYQ